MTPKNVTSQEIDERLRAAGSALPPAPATGEIKETVASTLRPVRPLPSARRLALHFFAVYVCAALAGGWALGMYGLRALSPVQRIVIFSASACAAGFAAIASAREMRPAGGRRLAGAALALAAFGFVFVFAALFHDYALRQFVRQGIPCLTAGLVFAVPAALAVSLVFRRGFALNLAAAGLAAGTVAGLAGLGALELHCPNLNAMHVMVWHVAVVVLSGLAGMLIGWFATRLRG